MSAPLVVNTVDGAVWTRREGSRDGEALYAPEKCGTCPQFVMVTLTELAELGIVGSADVLPVPALPEPQAPSGGYPPALPWAALMDDEDLHDFLGELADAAIRLMDGRAALVEVERACATWRLIAEAQHGHNTAPGPDAVTTSFGERAAESDPARRVAWRMLAEPEPEFDAYLHHPYTKGHDRPEMGGTQ